MKKLFVFLLCIIITASISCFFASESNLDVLDISQKIDSDTEISPEESDITCDIQEPCQVINKGCCDGEKLVAVRASSTAKYKSMRTQSCLQLMDQKAKENIFNICEGRENHQQILNAKAECKDKKCVIDEKTTKQNEDTEISPEADDVKCQEDTDCLIIDKGCCTGEKRVAINSDKFIKLKAKLRLECTKLLADKAKDNIHNLCQNRKVLGRFLQETARCVNNKCEIQEHSKEAEINPTEQDIACPNKQTCVVIDKGCCPGEKRVSINIKSLNKLILEKTTMCNQYFADKEKENDYEPCKDRSVKRNTLKERPRCENDKCTMD